MSSHAAQRRIACEQIAREAGALLRARFGRPGSVRIKGAVGADGRGYDVVTEVDFLSERIVLDAIAQLDADAVVLAEEGGLVFADRRVETPGCSVDAFAAEPAELWLVDPLDGTVNFAHGIPHFCVSIACWRAGQPVAGAVYDPLIDELFSFEWRSSDDRAAYVNGSRFEPSAVEKAASSMVYVGGSGTITLAPVIERFRGWRRLGSAALALAWVGAGRCGAYLQPGSLNAWDWGAAAPFVLATGGRLARPRGGAWDSTPSSTDGIVACGAAIEADVEAHVARCLT